MISILFQGWTSDPAVLGTIGFALILWVRGVRFLKAGAVATGWQDRWWFAPSFVAALAVMIVAACSPIDGFAAELFWVHMIQHLLLLMLVAPLLVAAAPWLPLWYGLPAALRRRLAAVPASRPAPFRSAPWWGALGFLVLFIAGTWVWHLPVLYDLALKNDIIHDYGEHNTFLLAGILFWLQVIPSTPFRPLLGVVGRILFLLVAVIQNVALSVYLSFAPVPLYAPYTALSSRPGGLTALGDQQLGGAIMWTVGDLPFVIALIGIVMAWLGAQMAEAGPDDERPPVPVGSQPA